MIKELLNYSQKLTAKLSKDDVTLPIDGDYLSDALPENGDYTYLIIDDGISVEVVRAYKDAGEVMIERGQGDTTAQTFPVGSCVTFKLTGAWIEAFVCQLPTECKPNPLPSECSGCNGCCD